MVFLFLLLLAATLAAGTFAAVYVTRLFGASWRGVGITGGLMFVAPLLTFITLVLGYYALQAWSAL